MEILAIVTIVSAVAAILSAIAAFVSWRQAKSALANQAFMDIQKEYRSTQMLFAVRTLWEFYREHGAHKFVDKYEEIRENDRKWIAQLDRSERLQAEGTTLHNQRRLVSQFYDILANLCANGVIPEKLVYATWSKADLRIIPDIIVPIENRLRNVLHNPPRPPLDDECALLRLYKRSSGK